MKTAVELDTVKIADRLAALRSMLAVVDIAVDGIEPIRLSRNPAVDGLRAILEQAMDEVEAIAEEIHKPKPREAAPATLPADAGWQ